MRLDTFAKRLRAWLARSGMTQRDFARGVGVSGNAVTDWVNGYTLPNFDALRRIVEFTGWSADWWLGVVVGDKAARS